MYVQNTEEGTHQHPNAVLALQKLTNRWERKADAPSKDNGKLWSTDKNKKLRRTSRMGSTSQGMPPAKRVLVCGCKQLLHWKQLPLLATFTSLSLTPVLSNGSTAGGGAGFKGDTEG